jgi:hypothetical protein
MASRWHNRSGRPHRRLRPNRSLVLTVQTPSQRYGSAEEESMPSAAPLMRRRGTRQHHAQALLTGQPPPTPAAKAVRRGQGDEEGPRRRWRQPDFARARPLAAAEEDGGRWRGWEARRLGFPPRHPRGGERESRGRFHKRKRPDGLSNGYAVKHDAMGFITQPTRPHGHTNQMTKDLFDSHDFSSNLVY